MARPLVYPSLVSTLVVPTVAEREKREQLLFPTYTSVPPAIHHTTLNSTDTYQRASRALLHLPTVLPMVAIRAAGAGSLSLRMY